MRPPSPTGKEDISHSIFRVLEAGAVAEEAVNKVKALPGHIQPL